MIQRPDVFEDFKEGPAVLGGQSGLVSWVAVGRLGLHPQSWALPLPGLFPQLYDKGTPPVPLTKARTVTNSELPPSDLPQDTRKLVFLNTESILLKVTQFINIFYHFICSPLKSFQFILKYSQDLKKTAQSSPVYPSPSFPRWLRLL